MNFQYKQLLGAMIVAGWDKETGGQVYGCPIGGTLVQENWTTDGSGSTYIWGYLDATFRYSPQLAAESINRYCYKYLPARRTLSARG